MSYIEKLLEEKYIDLLYEYYKKGISNQKFNYRLKKLEDELGKYNGTNKNNNVPDYGGYKSMVYKKHLKQGEDEVKAKYKAFQDKKYTDMPMAYYFILLLVKKNKDIENFQEQYSEEEISNNQMLLFKFLV